MARSGFNADVPDSDSDSERYHRVAMAWDWHGLGERYTTGPGVQYTTEPGDARHVRKVTV